MTIASRVGLLICQDLMFISKVTGTANSLGYQMETVGAPQGLIKAAAGSYACIILDLSLQPLAVADLTRSLGENPPPVIAFGAHVEVARLAEAREAGCREVLPRSQFNMQLPEILTRYLGAP
ncbi:MAG: response regulator [Planctomycetota bacterium]